MTQRGSASRARRSACAKACSGPPATTSVAAAAAATAAGTAARRASARTSKAGTTMSVSGSLKDMVLLSLAASVRFASLLRRGALSGCLHGVRLTEEYPGGPDTPQRRYPPKAGYGEPHPPRIKTVLQGLPGHMDRAPLPAREQEGCRGPHPAGPSPDVTCPRSPPTG